MAASVDVQSRAMLGQREYARLIREAGIKRIKFHGLGHTMAMLLLNCEALHDVSQRLGHVSVMMTAEICAHCLEESGRQIATTMGAILHG